MRSLCVGFLSFLVSFALCAVLILMGGGVVVCAVFGLAFCDGFCDCFLLVYLVVVLACLAGNWNTIAFPGVMCMWIVEYLGCVVCMYFCRVYWVVFV